MQIILQFTCTLRGFKFKTRTLITSWTNVNSFSFSSIFLFCNSPIHCGVPILLFIYSDGTNMHINLITQITT